MDAEALLESVDLTFHAGVDDCAQVAEVLRMDAVEPLVERVADFFGSVPEHRFPPIGVVDGLRGEVQIPNAVAEASRCDEESLVVPVEVLLEDPHLVELPQAGLDKAQSSLQLVVIERQGQKIADAKLEDRSQVIRLVSGNQSENGAEVIFVRLD